MDETVAFFVRENEMVAINPERQNEKKKKIPTQREMLPTRK